MIQVSNQAELQAALNSKEAQIEVISDFSINSQVNISYNVTISSLSKNIISKNYSYFSFMFRVINGAVLTLENIILDGDKDNHSIDNTANRALIYVTGGRVNLHDGSVLQNNNSYSDGGAIYLYGSTSYINILEMNGNSAIRGCYSRTNGGAIMVAVRNSGEALSIGGNAIIENNEANYGGGIYFRVYEPGFNNFVEIKENSQVVNNNARANGGGIYTSNLNDNTSAVTLYLSNSVNVSNNQAGNHGGGIFFYGTSQNDNIIMTDQVTMNNNYATNLGGAIYSYQNINSFSGTIFTSNQAGTGGAIYILSPITSGMEMLKCLFSENKATSGASGSGGAIWINNVSTDKSFYLSITETKFEGNDATAMGGALYLFDNGNNSVVNIIQCEINNNVSGTNGGGILLSLGNEGNISISNCDIIKNNSNNYGGGIFITNSSAGIVTTNINLCNISDNYAEGQGGGIRMSSGDGVINSTISDSKINNNLVNENSGGGIWSGGTNTNLILNGTTEINNNETKAGNGGGIYFNSEEGHLSLFDNVKILNNSAYQIDSDFGNHGGGISIVPGNVTIADNTEIAYNKALKFGGGISTGENAWLTIYNGTIHNNEANYGGGVYNKNSTFTFSGGKIYSNSAKVGGGIYNGN